ncbi:hypothetical protein HPB51_018985 [Rhipicephalus microplus]|uniref:Uncharacterized protein n=1 Tax=Rhipicephalus microplus TaxID=6941 RepID=A0A9J6EAI7_RHIMP|nr:hypothetical protein HPB51_018985 [Rhipicephalus microplus]
MTDLEGHCQNIISLRTDVEALRRDTARASDLLRKLDARVDEAENHSRRNNLIFYGLPESTGSEALVQVEQLVIKHCRDRLEVAEPEVNEVCENEVNQLVESPFEIVHDNSSCQEAIQGRIAELERLQEATTRKLALARKRYLKSEEEKEEIKKRLKGLFKDDQMRSMERLSAQGARWEAGTLVKSLQLRLACGSRGYGLLHSKPKRSNRGAPTNAPWKPIQTGITVATLTALDLQSTMLDKYNFSYFLLSRLSQDPLENLFSTLRSKNPIPRLYEFKCSLRSATLAQFLRPSKNASYSDDGAFMLLSLEDQPNNEGQEQVQLPDDLLDLTSEADQSIEYLAGYVVSKLLKRLYCENCRAALVSDKAPAKLISLKNFSESGLALANPSPAVVEILKVTENLFRSNREALIKNTVTAVELQAAVPRSISIVTCFPACHEIIKDIVGVYAKLRIHILVRNEASKIVPATNGKCASKSVGMHVAAANIR